MNKTKWYTRPVYLLVALALVLSLGVAGTVSQPNAQEVSASPGTESLMVDIVKVFDQYGVEKYYPYNFNISEDFLVNAAIAYKDIEKEGAASVSVSATIDPGQYVNLRAGEVSTKPLGSIARNGVTDVWWWVHCNGTGLSTITVTATGGGLSASDSIKVSQGEVAAETVLVVELIECPNATVLQESDNFVIKANVINVDQTIIAEDVWGIISGYEAVNASMADPPGNPDNWSLGDIWPGESAEVAWNLHCDRLGEGNVTIDATASNLDPTQIQEDICYVNQGEAPPEPGRFWVTVDAPDKWCIANCGYNNFTVDATVYNYDGRNATNVNLILNISGEANFRDSPADPIHPVGDMVYGQSNTTTWNISCLGEGNAIFTVLADGDESWANATCTDTTSQKSFLVTITDVTVTDDPSRNLTAPVKDKTLALETCENFTVNATLLNCDCYALDNISAVIDLPSDVELAPGSTVSVTHYNPDGTENWHNDYPASDTISGLTVCACCYYEIIWNLHCKASSVDQITVTAYDDGVALDNDWFWVDQKEKAHLAAGIEVYPGWISGGGLPEASQNAAGTINNFVGYSTLVTTAVDGVAVCQNFTIVIPVFNLGEAYATNVSVNYTIAGNTSCVLNKTLGYTNYMSDTIATLEGGEAGKFLLECHCDGEEDVTITVTAINGIDEITGEQVIDDNKYLPPDKDIMQIPFEVEIIQPEAQTNFSCSDEFAVKVIISNNSTDPGNDVSGVNATIAWTGPGCAEFVDEANQSYTIPLGDLDVNGTAQEAAWLMHCCGMGDVYFTVTVTAESPLMNIVRTVTVIQEGTTTLGVEILSPGPDQYYQARYATCEQFAVTAKVYNDGSKPAPNVTASIKPGDYCEVLGSPTIEIGALGPGEYQLISWTLHVYEAGEACWILPNHIYVWATAPCAALVTDSEIVLVYPAAHLVVEAEAPTEVEVGSKFNVTATVNNTGWADAAQVVLRIDTGANSALAPGESLTKTIGTLVGFWVHEDASVTWTLQCEGEGKSTIIITPEGNDECGWHPKQDTETGRTIWRDQPGRAINPAFLKPDDVTVEQKTIIPGPEVNTIDMVTGWNFISVPKKMENATVGKLLEDITYSTAFGYNATTGVFVPLTPSSAVVVLDGYWIGATAPGTITLIYASGGMEVPPSKDLTGKAWNAIGFSSTSENGLPAVATLMSVAGSWSTLLGWDAAGQSYEDAIIKGVNDDERMYPGKGYWLWVTADDTLAAIGA